MTQKHTSGRIKVGIATVDQGYYCLCAEGRLDDEVVERVGPCGYTKIEADAEHLAACWNACEGINPEAVPEVIAALEFCADDDAENCELWSEESRILRINAIHRVCRAALAKAKGGQE